MNLCGAHGSAITMTPQFYTVATAPDLTKNTATIKLIGNTVGNSAQPDLLMTMTVLNSETKDDHSTDILRISWNYFDTTIAKK